MLQFSLLWEVLFAGFGFLRLSLGWFDCLQLVGWLFVWWVACLRVGLRIWLWFVVWVGVSEYLVVGVFAIVI